MEKSKKIMFGIAVAAVTSLNMYVANDVIEQRKATSLLNLENISDAGEYITESRVIVSCESGGTGTVSCSISKSAEAGANVLGNGGNLGSNVNCSATCGNGYFACCNANAITREANCVCHKN